MVSKKRRQTYHGRKVALAAALLVPRAGLLEAGAGRIDVVLRRGRLALPLVRFGGVGAGQLVGLARRDVHGGRNGHRLGA